MVDASLRYYAFDPVTAEDVFHSFQTQHFPLEASARRHMQMWEFQKHL